MRKEKYCSLYWLPMLLTVLFVLPAAEWAQTGSGDGTSLNRFEGNWKGICADGKPFVLLTLRHEAGAMTGTLEIANMQGSEGQCESVTDPPSKDHAMHVSDSRVNGKALTFNGSANAKFEMTTAGPNSARLKFLGTPVEENPWTLERVK